MTRSALILLGLLLSVPLHAAVFTVTKSADTLDGACDHDCSLREAVSAANAAAGTDVVAVPAGVYLLDRLGAGEDANATGDLDVHDRMILVGAGPGSTELSGRGFDRVLDLRAAAEIYGVTIRAGRADGDGGGILVRPSSSFQPVVVQRSVVTGNLAQNGGDGGGIAVFGFLEVRDSAILENHAEGEGGGIGAGETGSFTLENVTLSGNFAAGSGGALDYREDAASISAATIVFNQAHVSGGGISARPSLPFPGTFEHLFGSIVAENLAPVDPDCSGAGGLSVGYNVFGTPGCEAATDRTGTGQSPLRAVFRLPRTDLGPTPVHELLPDSPALDLVPAQFCEPADQVGQARTPPCDAGAWEKVERPVCVPGGSVVCLQGGRFRVSALWTLDERFPGNPATGVPLTDDTGIHWFFGPENLEVMTKVLDGCGLNGRWWVFTSGLTDVGVTLRVEDLKTGRVWEHDQPKGRTYAPRLDTEAFPCDLPEENASAATAPDLAPPPNARVLRVTKTADSDDGACNHDCSLREAVLEANLRGEAGVIVLEPGVYTLAIPGGGEDLGHTGDLDVTGDLVILGSGADRTIVDGGGLDRVLDVRVEGSLELHGVTVQGGWARPGGDLRLPNGGGGIRNLSSLALVRSVVRSNRADHEGGGIASFGVSLVVRDSTVSGNVAGFSGGGIAAELSDLENVTLSGNRAGLSGGGFLAYDDAALRNVTIAGNTANVGGGLAVEHFCQLICPPIPVLLQRTVIAGNASLSGPGGGGPFADCVDMLPSSGEFNVFGIGEGCNPRGHDLYGTPAQPLDARLTPLGDHGGPTPTHALLLDSPAIDVAPSCAGGDQRGRPRPADGDGDGAALCDAGAVERQPGCQPDAETLCLGAEDRFRVTARWTAGGNAGAGKAVPLVSHTGSFWFFDPANLELTVKVLDGCGLGGHWWVFLSGLTDAGVEVEVEDTRTGETWTHSRPAGTPLQPVLDTEALPCVNPGQNEK